jgi:hypothetical protein
LDTITYYARIRGKNLFTLLTGYYHQHRFLNKKRRKYNNYGKRGMVEEGIRLRIRGQES